MNVSSTPFIRNDYWPDYNDINQLNQRIDEAENEISLVNIRLSADIENVSNNLNAYVNNQANTTITNNAIVNNLNANYAEGRFANFDNTFTNNAYIENLTVNKPVFDITLNTPHLENTTSLGGNFYNANLIDAKFSGDISGDLNVINVNQLNAVNAVIANLFVNTSAAPIQSSAVLGYDSEGRVIPIHATFDVGFPEDADYLWTDSAGTAFKGTKATEIGAVENLITAYGVKNAIDALNAEVLDNFNLVNNALNDIDEWENSFENSVANSFNDVNNTFNDVNNFINDSLNDVNNTFNDVNDYVNNTFNDVNNYVSDNFNNFNNNFDNIDNNFANADNNFNAINDLLNALLLDSTSNARYWTVAKDSIPNTFETIRFATPADTTGVNISTGNGAIYAKVSGTELVFSSNIPILNTDQGMLRVFNSIMGNTESNYQNASTARGVFGECVNFNQNILIPNGVTSLGTIVGGSLGTKAYLEYYGAAFANCRNLDQNILIPNSVTNLQGAFYRCVNLNQNILIPNSVTITAGMFTRCSNLNQNILIPNGIADISAMFEQCGSLNQSILIPPSVTTLYGTFEDCNRLNQDDIYIYSQNVQNFGMDSGTVIGIGGSTFNNVNRIGNIHVPTSVPKSTSNFMYNCLVNGLAGPAAAAANIINDLPVDIAVWPPEA